MQAADWPERAAAVLCAVVGWFGAERQLPPHQAATSSRHIKPPHQAATVWFQFMTIGQK
ncbi:hypothetical protein E4U39_003634 [Claviceps sp. Clav50 group G5]|nr:hypothetical protein E4U39_003634 [Claviceps sp. Clav50 group G5]